MIFKLPLKGGGLGIIDMKQKMFLCWQSGYGDFVMKNQHCGGKLLLLNTLDLKSGTLSLNHLKGRGKTLKNKDLVYSHISCKVGKSDGIRFWSDIWLGCVALKTNFPLYLLLH